MHSTNGNVYNRQKSYGTIPNHVYGVSSGLSMQTVQDMAGVSGAYMNFNTFSSKENSEPIMFDSKKSFFNSVKYRRFKKRYASLLGLVVVICFLGGVYWILHSRRHHHSYRDNNATAINKSNGNVYEDEALRITSDNINEQFMNKHHEHIHSSDYDIQGNDWSDFEEDWLDEHDFYEEEIDDIEDVEHNRSHYAKLINEVDSPKQVEDSSTSDKPLISTDNNQLPSEVKGEIPPKPLSEAHVYDDSVVYFPKTIHLLGRVGSNSEVNGKYTIMMHPYHEESPWVHAGRLIWYKIGKGNIGNHYIFYEKKLHNWVITNKFDLLSPDPIAFLPDHGVMPVKGVGKHGCKAQHYWYFREKNDDNTHRLVMDRSVLVTDDGILIDSISPDHGENKNHANLNSGSSTNQEVIGLRLHKNQIHIDHKYHSSSYSSNDPHGKHNEIEDPYNRIVNQ
ncbi:hypothetical protein FG379_001287 [Cryptosporidium bovis]|uniref:uncharacterized protein n=1 Tax=Cryptosporidium bovis TaxID=310047 RepID=UPI00351A4F9B|nr:hypothetical protein FG379_001287 [Cryptosporidium bovis]